MAFKWDDFYEISLDKFSNNFYIQLENRASEFNPDIQKFINNLIKYNWFKHYKTLSGLEEILIQMEKRTKFPSNLAASIDELKLNYDYFMGHFFQFMKEIIEFTKMKTNNL